MFERGRYQIHFTGMEMGSSGRQRNVLGLAWDLMLRIDHSRFTKGESAGIGITVLGLGTGFGGRLRHVNLIGKEFQF